MKKSDLAYKYSWNAVPGDDPSKTKDDATRFSRHEGYEVLHLINSFRNTDNKELSLHSKKVIEWMINEHLPSSIQGRDKVKKWIIDNFSKLKDQYAN